MTRVLLAEFADPQALTEAARAAVDAGVRPLDAFTPFPVSGLDELLATQRSWIRPAMAVGGFGIAALAYFIQWYSSVFDYPINSGGRPLHSWPVFLLVPFEVGVLGAAVAGFLALLWQTGLPRLHDPVFAVPALERASQDRFFLAVPLPDDRRRLERLQERLRAAEPLSLQEVVL